MLNTNFSFVQNDYAAWLTTSGYSSGMIYDFKHRVRDFFEWLQAKNINAVYEITQNHISEYYEYLQIRPNKRREGGLGVSHLNHNFGAVDKLLEFLNKMEMDIIPSPTNFRIKTFRQEQVENIKPFTREEIQLLQNNIDKTYTYLPFKEREANHEELKLSFALHYGCGLRRSEGYELTLDKIDFNNKIIFIKDGKYYKDRKVPMSPNVYKAVEHYMYNFRNLLKLDHNRLYISTSGTIYKRLKYLQDITENESVKSKNLTLHILRHSISSHLLQNGMPIENISKFLGHSSLDTTQIYTHLI